MRNITLFVLIMMLLVTWLPVFGGETDEAIFYCPFDGSVDARTSKGSPGAISTKGAFYVDGIQDKAICFTEGGCATYNSKGNIDFEEGTITLWTKILCEPKDLNKGHIYFVTHAGGRWFTFYMDKIYKAICFGRIPPRSTIGFTVRNWKKDEWHFLAITWNEDFLAIYEDGKLMKVQNQEMSPEDKQKMAEKQKKAGKSFTIGKGKCSNWCMDEFKIYNRVLTEDEVKGKMENVKSEQIDI